jgi:hypothetical protein
MTGFGLIRTSVTPDEITIYGIELMTAARIWVLARGGAQPRSGADGRHGWESSGFFAREIHGQNDDKDHFEVLQEEAEAAIERRLRELAARGIGRLLGPQHGRSESQ